MFSIGLRVVAKARSLKNDALFAAGVPYHRILGGKRNFILMYHGVCSRKDNPFNARHTYVKDFERQIRYLSQQANVISVKDFFQGKFDDTQCNVALTFDDGFKNNLTLAAPILKKYGVPASMYITGLDTTAEPYVWADFLQIASFFTDKKIELQGELYKKSGNAYVRERDGKALMEVIKNEYPEYTVKQELYKQLGGEFEQVKENYREFWELMNEQDIKELSEYATITIGSHGFLHNNLGNINPEHAKRSLEKSKQYLESITHKPMDEIAYPDGSYSDELTEYAAALGIRYQLAAGGESFDPNNNLLRDRVEVYQCASWGNQLLF